MNWNSNWCRPIWSQIRAVIPICIQDGRPSQWLGTPGGSEEPHPQAGTRAYYEYVEESDADTH
jgi:hypothetical protein